VALVPRRPRRPTRIASAAPLSLHETALAALFVLAGCLVLLGLHSGLDRLIHYYTHNTAPIEYILGLPPFQDPDALTPLVRHFDPPLPKPKNPAFHNPAVPPSTYPGPDWQTMVLVAGLLGGVVTAGWLLDWLLSEKPAHRFP